MNKPDEAHVWTDEELAELEKRIAAEYKKAAEELQARIDAYFESFKKWDEEQKALLEEGEITKEYYNARRAIKIAQGERFEALRDRIAERMGEAKDVANAYTDDTMMGIYSLNRNYTAYTIEKQIGADVGFDLWDEWTVKRLIVEQPDLMPYYSEVRASLRGFDLAKGKTKITAVVTSSVLQGKSVKGIADDLQHNIPTMNRNSAIRAARTAVTGAENAGRLDSYFAAEEMGIKLKKQWMATLDGRTRHTHRILDGQVQDNDKPFEVEGREIMFPGDPNADGDLVYNCRCTMVADIEDVDTSDIKRRARTETGENEIIDYMTYSEWEQTKQGQKSIEAEQERQREAARERRDRKQFEEYRSILGDNMPKTFETFQRWKYNEPEKWEELQRKRRAATKGGS